MSPTTSELGKLCTAYGLTLSRLMHMVEDDFAPLIRRSMQSVRTDPTIGFQRKSFMFTLRRYAPTDQGAVEHLHVSAIQQTGAYLGRGPWDDDVYAIEEVYLKNGGEFLIGECDGLFVAMGALKRTSPERAEIKRMRVHPDYQGCGYGQRILDELEVRARSLGYQILHLDTSILQIPAQKLYEKNGFREVGRDTYRQEVGGDTSQLLEVILYEKPLV